MAIKLCYFETRLLGHLN